MITLDNVTQLHQKTEIEEEKLEDKQWAADFFDITKRTVDTWIKKYDLPYYDMPDGRKFKPSDCRAFREKRRRNAAA